MHAGLPGGRRRRADRRARRAGGAGRRGLGRGRGDLPRAAARSSCTRPRRPRSAPASGAAASRRSPRWAASRSSYYVQDGVVPRTKLPEVLRRIAELERRVRAPRGERLPRRRRQPAPARALRRRGRRARPSGPSSSRRRSSTLCIDAGGSLTGEHGVGVDKACSMPKLFGERDLEAMQRLRRGFDPDGLANPGKVFPTPRLCGEVPGPVPRAPAGAGRACRASLSRRRSRRRRPCSRPAARVSIDRDGRRRRALDRAA